MARENRENIKAKIIGVAAKRRRRKASIWRKYETLYNIKAITSLAWHGAG